MLSYFYSLSWYDTRLWEAACSTEYISAYTPQPPSMWDPKGCFMLISSIKVSQSFHCSHISVFFPHCGDDFMVLFPKTAQWLEGECITQSSIWGYLTQQGSLSSWTLSVASSHHISLTVCSLLWFLTIKLLHIVLMHWPSKLFSALWSVCL